MTVDWFRVPGQRGALCADTPRGRYLVRPHIKGERPFVLLVNDVIVCLFCNKADAVQAVENQFASW